MRKRILSVLLILILSLGYSVQVCATTVDELREEQEKTQEHLDELNDRMEGMEQQKDAVAGEITVLDTQLVDILTSISICEDEIAAKEDEIDLVKVELEEAEEPERAVYPDPEHPDPAQKRADYRHREAHRLREYAYRGPREPLVKVEAR